ncbi:MAG: hypothetical protein NVS2B8_18390 [Vulcanimicrobiaceae bacterium]
MSQARSPFVRGLIRSIAAAWGRPRVAYATNASASAPISLDIRELDIYDAVRLLSTQAAINVVVDSSVVHHNVTMRLQRVSFDQALQTLAQANDLQTVRVGNVIFLGTTEAMNRRYPSGGPGGTRHAVLAVHNGAPDDVAKNLTELLPKGTLVVPDRRTSSILVTGSAEAVDRARTTVASLDAVSQLPNRAIPMRYVKASDALKALQATLTFAPPQSAFAADQQNQLLLTGSDDFLAQAEALVANIDRPGQQVRYEVRVTDLTPTDTSNIGFLFGGGTTTPNGSFASSFIRNSLQINAQLNALVTKGEGKILARPTISSLNNIQASLLVGSQYPVVYFDARTGTQQVQFINVGVNLNVTPTIGRDGTITTNLETDYSQVNDFVNGFPVVTTRKAQSTLRVRDGETIVIAGLFSDVDVRTLTKVPFLGDLPFIGELFRNRVRTHNRDEVVFLITPHLVSDDDPAKAAPPSALRQR